MTKTKMIDYLVIIGILLFPVIIGLLARIDGAMPGIIFASLVLLAVLGLIIAYFIKFIWWLDKKVGPTDF